MVGKQANPQQWLCLDSSGRSIVSRKSPLDWQTPSTYLDSRLLWPILHHSALAFVTRPLVVNVARSFDVLQGEDYF